MDQSGNSPVLSGSALSSIFLDNGSLFRRDFNETVSGVSLELGAAEVALASLTVSPWCGIHR